MGVIWGLMEVIGGHMGVIWGSYGCLWGSFVPHFYGICVKTPPPLFKEVTEPGRHISYFIWGHKGVIWASYGGHMGRG